MNKMKLILYSGLACILIPLFAKEGPLSPTTPLNIKEIPRNNGELDVSKIEEILLKAAERTQFAGRFGIVVANIDDLIKVPEFIGFRPVLVMGKLTYRREGNSYVCHIQWEKVALITPAFNKVKRLDKGLTSRFNHSGVEITKEFLMTARGDIPTFIKNVKELFNTPLATESDLTDKERDKLNELNNNARKATPLLDAGMSTAKEQTTRSKGYKAGDRSNTSGQSGADTSQRCQGGELSAKTQAAQNRDGGDRSLKQKGENAKTDRDAAKKNRVAVVGSEGVEPSRSDGDVPQVRVSSGGDADKRGDARNNRNGRSADADGSQQQKHGTGQSGNGESDSTDAATGTSRGFAAGGAGTNPSAPSDSDIVRKRGTNSGSSLDQEGGRSHSSTNRANESSTLGNSTPSTGGDSRRTGGGEAQNASTSSPASSYHYGYDQGFSGERQTASVSTNRQSRADDLSSGGGSTRDTPAGGSSGAGDFMNATTEGCSVRVDLPQLRAIQQERLIIRRNGREERSPCKDGGSVFTIHKDYDHPYHVDLIAGKACPKYSYYYIDSRGRRKDVRIEGQEVGIDLNQPVVLQETEEGCTPKPEYGRDSTTMIKCKRRFYIKHSGEKEFATDCLETSIKAKVEETTEGCEVDHDFSANRSFIQQRRVYKFPGDIAFTEYSKCKRENREPIPHTILSCEPEVENGKWFERNRAEIKVNGRAVVIRPCERISLSGIPLEKEYSCTYSHLSDKSHPYVRKYYTFNGQKRYVTGLEVDLTVVYPHVKRVLSYDYKDDTKQAIPMEKYFFKGVNNEEVDVRIAHGVPVAYENTRETEIKNEGSFSYDGCNKITRRFKYLKWKRPDGSYYYEKANEEEPIREYVCQIEFETYETVLETHVKYLAFPYKRRAVLTDGEMYIANTFSGIMKFSGQRSIDEIKNMELWNPEYPKQNHMLSKSARVTDITAIYKMEQKIFSVTKKDGALINRQLISTRVYDHSVPIGNRND